MDPNKKNWILKIKKIQMKIADVKIIDNGIGFNDINDIIYLKHNVFL